MDNIFLGYLIKEFHISNDSFIDRMISQKTIYILQEMGFDKKYEFKWYHYGVYSVELANDIFSQNYKIIEIPSREEGIINKFKEFVGENKENVKFLEIASSIIFISKENPFLSEKEIFNELIKRKPHLNDFNKFDFIYQKVIKIIQ